MSWANLAEQLKNITIPPLHSTQTTHHANNTYNQSTQVNINQSSDTGSIEQPKPSLQSHAQPNTTTASGSGTPPTTTTTTTTTTNPICHVVLDSGAFIASTLTQLTSYYRNNNNVRYYIVPDIETELVDANAYSLYTNFPYGIIKRNVLHSTAYDTVVKFAKQSGNYFNLSNIDIQVAALAYQLECEINEYKYVQLVPTIQAHATQQQHRNKQSNKIDSNDHNDDTAGTETINSTGVGNVSDTDSNDDDWITSDNVHLHHTPTHTAKPKRNQHRRRKNKTKQSLSSIVTITTDYQLQNLLLQLHCRIHSMNGQCITQIKMFIKRCYTCNCVIYDLNKSFCTDCGNHTLIKQSAYIDQHTNTLHYNQQLLYQPSIRGTRYSIPKPQGGRLNKDLILTEDMMPSFKKLQRQKKYNTGDNNDLYVRVSEYNNLLDLSKPYDNTATYGYGKQNPNAVKRNIQRSRNT